MPNADTYVDPTGTEQPERRANDRVRAVFERAWDLLKPILEEARGGAEASGFSLVIRLRDEFPELSSADLHLLVSAATRMQRERRQPIPARAG